jgi:ribosomal protein S12 methylthiotransferase
MSTTSDKPSAKSTKLSVLTDSKGQSPASCVSSISVASSVNPEAVKASDFAGNVAMVTLGCSKNQVDSEIMLGALRARGFQPVSEPENADLIVVNTCAFLTSAVQEGIDKVLELSELKKTGRCRKLIVAGCMVERYRDDLAKEFPEIDRFISTDELLSVADDEDTTEQCLSAARRPYFLYDEAMPRVRDSSSSHSAYLKISEGCDRPCSFCIIPKIRGAFRSRAPSSIVREVEQLLDEGVKEINFVAQDLTAYGNDNKAEFGNLTGLLTELDRTTADRLALGQQFWLRLFYAYPVGVTEQLVKQIVASPVICNYLDLPLQHISNNVLKAMNRPLGENGTRRLIEQMRIASPELNLRTTFIVGFPGETAEDIESLGQFISEGHFRHVGVFTYSDEAEAKAFDYPDRVSEEEKISRRDYLMELQQVVVAKQLEAEVGKSLRVLIDGFHKESDLLLSARSEWQAPEDDGEVIINDLGEFEGDPEMLRGKFATVTVTEVAGYDLVGTLEVAE